MKRALFFFLFLMAGSSFYAHHEKLSDQNPLPGRMGTKHTYRASFHEGEIYFYMGVEKLQSTLNLVKGLEDSMILSVDRVSPSKVHIVPEIMKDPAPMENSLFSDKQGRSFLDEYINKTNLSISHLIGYSFLNPQAHLELVLNQDFWTPQKRSSLGHTLYDYTMVDWQMSEGTLSGIIIEDGPKGDRFIMALFPRDACSMSILSKGLFSYAYFSPIDYQSISTPGSTKGKNIFLEVQGNFQENCPNCTKNDTINLKINQPVISHKEKQYPNGLSFKKQLEDFCLNTEACNWVGARENVDIFECRLKKDDRCISEMAHYMNLKNMQFKGMYRLVKRTAGLSQLRKMNIDIPEGSVMLMMNRSSLPEGCAYFNLSEDQTDSGLPWIQLYRCPPKMWIKMSKICFERLALTPLEEFIFRERLDGNIQADGLKKRIVTEMDLLIFTPSNFDMHYNQT